MDDDTQHSSTDNADSTRPAPDAPRPEPERPRPEDRLSSPLRRPRSDRMIAGVCAGLGRAWRVDPILLRLAFVAATILFFPFGPLAYVVLWVLMPQDPLPAELG